MLSGSLPAQSVEREELHRVKKLSWGRPAAGSEGGSPGCPAQETCGGKTVLRVAVIACLAFSRTQTLVLQFAWVLSTSIGQVQ